jgi:hypothetical protein
LDQAMLAAEEMWAACEGPKVEEDRLRSLWSEAASAFFAAEDAALETEPETITDALLVIALAATYARRAAEYDMNHEPTSRGLRDAGLYSRRAADFIAANLGHDLGALLGAEYDHRLEEA